MSNRQGVSLPLQVQEARRRWPTALVSMPFVSMRRPSIQIGLLKAIGAASGFPVATYHLNLDFARQIGPELYEALCQHRGHLYGDWIFSIAAFGEAAPDPEDRLLDLWAADIDEYLGGLDEGRERLRTLRHVDVPRYLDGLMAAVPWERYRVVGFTSTFQQNTASFALARRIKERFPHIVTLFGGANFEGEMGIEFVRSVPCIDYGVVGEGDCVFPDFLIALQEERDPAETPGVIRRCGDGTTPLTMRPPFRHMDTLPTPDYTEYFDRAEALGLLRVGGRREVAIPFESARGCWWGQKHHCTFCGLNGTIMSFRSKSPDRVFRELAEMARRYHTFHFYAVDNIVDFSYLKSVFPRFIESRTDYQLFYEVKSNLTREKVELLRKAGVYRVQPGIESLSSRILALMRKGVTAIQNVNTLRWCLYYDVKVGWNLIWGFPGETKEDFLQQLDLMRQIIHLPPPDGGGRIWMERFSPIFFDTESYPATYRRPEASYRYVYPAGMDLNRLAYFFDYELEGALPDSDLHEHTSRQIEAWQAAWRESPRPRLTFWSAPDFLQIDEYRDRESPGIYTFTHRLASLYAACSDRPESASSLKQRLHLSWPESTIESLLEEHFVSHRLMMREGKLFLSLALPATGGR